ATVAHPALSRRKPVDSGESPLGSGLPDSRPPPPGPAQEQEQERQGQEDKAREEHRLQRPLPPLQAEGPEHGDRPPQRPQPHTEQGQPRNPDLTGEPGLRRPQEVLEAADAGRPGWDRRAVQAVVPQLPAPAEPLVEASDEAEDRKAAEDPQRIAFEQIRTRNLG